jgi:hypothetical protein
MTILFSFNELENKSKCPSRTRGYLKPRWANYTPKGDVRRWRGPPSAARRYFSSAPSVPLRFKGFSCLIAAMTCDAGDHGDSPIV